jgi:hypothetical protein
MCAQIAALLGALGKMRQLGVARPRRELAEVTAERCLRAALLPAKLLRLESLAPGDRHSFSEVLELWSKQTSRFADALEKGESVTPLPVAPPAPPAPKPAPAPEAPAAIVEPIAVEPEPVREPEPIDLAKVVPIKPDDPRLASAEAARRHRDAVRAEMAAKGRLAT